MKIFEFDGRKIAYSSNTIFEVQVGKGKSAYKTIQIFKGALIKALICFECIAVSYGGKKRLYSPDMNRPVLARVLT